jgi:hypothetical protein
MATRKRSKSSKQETGLAFRDLAALVYMHAAVASGEEDEDTPRDAYAMADELLEARDGEDEDADDE